MASLAKSQSKPAAHCFGYRFAVLSHLGLLYLALSVQTVSLQMKFETYPKWYISHKSSQRPHLDWNVTAYLRLSTLWVALSLLAVCLKVFAISNCTQFSSSKPLLWALIQIIFKQLKTHLILLRFDVLEVYWKYRSYKTPVTLKLGKKSSKND